MRSDAFAQMSTPEKLRLMEDLWDQLCQSESELPVPQWHKDLLDQREREAREGKAKFVDWETAKRQIAERVK